MAFSIVLAVALVFLLLLFICKLVELCTPNFFDSLKGKHVVITGGARGIGLALARKCLLEGACATILDISEENLEKARHALISSICKSDRLFLKAVDVADPTAVAKAIDESSRWRPIDILICNAGIVKTGLFDEMAVEDLDKGAQVNFLGCVYPLHAALPHMKQRSLQNPSSIVLMSSVSGFFGLYGCNVYSPTKFAVNGLAGMLKLELMPHNIRVNLVCPSFTDTTMLDEADKFASSSNAFSMLSLYKRSHALTPDQVANLAVEGVKRGDFLITTEIIGFLLGILARGPIPADSITRAVLELLLLLPLRVCSFAVLPYIRKVVGHPKWRFD